ncbi:MAG: AraC family transcriptional regulator [Lachnospiraceae bacterium]|nr:AraC family transcriptional regulator [Lachnospiraceae bacterium]
MTITYRKYQFQPDFSFLYMQSTRVSSSRDFIHFHNCLEIAVCEQGIMEWNIEGVEFLLHPGEFCILPPFVTHASCHPLQEAPVLCHYLFFEPEKLLSEYYPSGLPESFSWYRSQNISRSFAQTEYPQIFSLLCEIIRETQQKQEFFREKIPALVEYLMIHMCRQISTEEVRSEIASRKARAMVFPAISYIDKNDSLDLSPELLAKICDMTPRRFNRCFFEALGKTPMQYIRQVKVQKACDLLLQTEDSILNIAYTAGFSSVAAFNRSFLQIIGQTPSAFRNEKRIYRKKQTAYAPYQST